MKSLFWLKVRHYIEHILFIFGSASRGSSHINKRDTLRFYSKKFNLKILVETGTYLGEMVDAVKNDFMEIYSIELSPELYDRAKDKFRPSKHIHVLQGDSSEVLPSLVNRLKQPTLFWLDAHYSGGITAKSIADTPIIKELTSIFVFFRLPFVILIDDARLFNGTNDYPTLSELREIIRKFNSKLKIETDKDIIRIFSSDV